MMTLAQKPVCMFFVFLSTVLLATPVLAIGNRTHAEISERAADRYCSGPQAMVPGLAEFMGEAAVRKALYSGSTFPDWGYGGIDQDAAEQAHWTPFHRVFFEMLRERLHAAWTEEDKQNVAFFLGDLSHSVADMPWHFDAPTDRSFISAAGAAQGCSHIDCDTGSDMFLLQREGVTPDIGLMDYYWPSDLLVEIYERAGRKLSRGIIETGHTRQRAYWVVAKSVSDMQVASYAARCSWIGENLDGYYYGGLDHNAAAVSIWFKYYFARLCGGYYFQDMPVYGRGNPPDWVGYYGVADAGVYRDAPDNNAGKEPVIELAADGASAMFLKVDMAEVPSDKAIGATTLWLAAQDLGDAKPAIEIATCGAAWNEGGGATDNVNGTRGVAGAAGELTWANAHTDALAWQAADARVAAPGWIAVDVTALAKAWAADPATNHGVALRLSAPAGAAGLRMYSSEAWKSQTGTTGGERVALRPALVIAPAQ